MENHLHTIEAALFLTLTKADLAQREDVMIYGLENRWSKNLWLSEIFREGFPLYFPDDTTPDEQFAEFLGSTVGGRNKTLRNARSFRVIDLIDSKVKGNHFNKV